MTAERGRPGWKLSLVVPCFNEAANIRPLYSDLTRVIVGLADDYEIIFVNDGSRDATLAEIKGGPRGRSAGGLPIPQPQLRT